MSNTGESYRVVQALTGISGQFKLGVARAAL